MSLGLLAWLGTQTTAAGLPDRIAVDTQDRYLLDLLVRHFAQRTRRGARVFEWSKALDARIRAEVEETSLFGPKPLFLVLGAPRGWVKKLRPSRMARVVSQQPGANLRGETYHYRDLNLILRVLVRILELPWLVRDLRRVDWSWARAWTDFEPLLVRGKLLGWSVSDLMRAASARTQGDIFALIRDGEWWSIHFLAKRYGRDWLFRHLVEFTVQVAQVRQMKGATVRRVRDTLGLAEWQAEQVCEAAHRTDPADLHRFAARILALDPLVARSSRGFDLLLMGAKI